MFYSQRMRTPYSIILSRIENFVQPSGLAGCPKKLFSLQGVGIKQYFWTKKLYMRKSIYFSKVFNSMQCLSRLEGLMWGVQKSTIASQKCKVYVFFSKKRFFLV